MDQATELKDVFQGKVLTVSYLEANEPSSFVGSLDGESGTFYLFSNSITGRKVAIAKSSIIKLKERPLEASR